MKKLSLALLACMALAMTGCGVATPTPTGVLYHGTTSPVAVTANTLGTKKGEATCTSILSLVAFGDCSTQTAAKDGNITKISTVDYKSMNVFGIFGTYTTIVTGE